MGWDKLSGTGGWGKVVPPCDLSGEREETVG